jgi:hypothetical protein
MQVNRILRRIEKLEARHLPAPESEQARQLRARATEQERWLDRRLEAARRRLAAHTRGEWPPKEAGRRNAPALLTRYSSCFEDNLAERLIGIRERLRRTQHQDSNARARSS